MNDNFSYEKRRLLWEKMEPVYIPHWAWKKAREHEPEKYKKEFPVYQGKKVYLT